MVRIEFLWWLEQKLEHYVVTQVWYISLQKKHIWVLFYRTLEQKMWKIFWEIDNEGNEVLKVHSVLTIT